MTTDDRPAWVKTSVTIWEEDDAKPEGREMRAEAWARLFGCPEPDNARAEADYDGGDYMMFLHEHGRISAFSYMGESIEMTQEAAEKYASAKRHEIQRATWLCERIEAAIAKTRSGS